MARRDKRTGLFYELAAKFSVLRSDADQIVCCPLCLREFPFEAIEQLRAEHIVSEKLGGRSQTLTCFDCNSGHGTTLDSQLISAMKAMDSIEGTEPIPTMMSNPKGRIAADLLLPVVSKTAPITLQVIGKASSPAATEDLRNNLAPGFELTLHMRFGFIPERYWRAVLRSAYLAVFQAEGYQYVFSAGAARVRGVVNGTAPVRANIIMEAFPEQEPPGDLLVMPHAFNDVGECFTVLLRLRSKRTRYLAVFLPGKHGSDWDLLGTLYEHATRLRIETKPHEWDSTLIINLGYDPVAEFRKGRHLLNRLLR